MSDPKELLSEAETLVAAAGGYEPWDREEKLGTERWDPRSPEVIRWIEVHGHDPRLKCYPEFGCQLLEIPWAKALLQTVDERDKAVEVLERILFLWDSSIAKGMPFFNSTRDASSVRVVIAPYIDAFERKQHAAYEAELEKDD